jgi:hypothetical protein
MQLRIGGFSASQLRGANFTAKELSRVGFTIAELHEAGWSAMQLLAIGFGLAQISSVSKSLTIHAQFFESYATLSCCSLDGAEALVLDIRRDASLSDMIAAIGKKVWAVGLLVLPHGRVLLPSDMAASLEQLLLEAC